VRVAMKKRMLFFGDYTIFVFIAIAIIFISLIGLIIVNVISKKSENEFLFLKKKKKYFSLKIYSVLQSSIFRRYVEKIKKAYELVCPLENKKIIKMTVRTIMLIVLAGTLGTVFWFFRTPSIYNLARAILFAVVISKALVNFSVSNLESELRADLDFFLSNVKHHFYMSNMVDTAIVKARKDAGQMMKAHSSKILDVLDCPKKKRDFEKRKYIKSISNIHLQMFLSLCSSVMDIGDKIINNVSLFMLNIQLLRTDIHEEKIRVMEAEHRFFGMAFAIIFPVFTLDLIENWCANMIPAADNFYNGIFGNIYIIAIFVATIVCYMILNELKETRNVIEKEYVFLKRLSDLKPIKKLLNNYEKTHFNTINKTKNILYQVNENINGKQFFLKRAIYFLITLLLCNMLFFSIHMNNRKELTVNADNIKELSGLTNDNLLEPIREIILKYTNLYKETQELDEELLKIELKKEGIFRNDILLDSVKNEIVGRIRRYQNQYYHWYELLISIFISFIAYYFPLWMIYFKKRVVIKKMEIEVMQFQTQIMMIMYFDNTTVLDILEAMESVANVFKRPLRECINEYAYGDIKALKSLRKKVDYIPFRRIVDSLISADKIGVQKAFDELATERKHFREEKLQESKISLDKSVDVGNIIAFIPGVLTIGYLLIPFIMYFLESYQMYQQLMEELY